jgi:hypothetical protein
VTYAPISGVLGPSEETSGSEISHAWSHTFPLIEHQLQEGKLLREPIPAAEDVLQNASKVEMLSALLYGEFQVCLLGSFMERQKQKYVKIS